MYYVYIYLDPRTSGKYRYGEFVFDQEPFYVGKGRGCRDQIHVYKYGNNRLKNSILKKLEDLNLKPIILYVKEQLEEYEAFELERKLIFLIGRRDIGLGPLSNMTDGGEGRSGNISQRRINNPMYGKTHTLEVKQAQSKLAKDIANRLLTSGSHNFLTNHPMRNPILRESMRRKKMRGSNLA
jgi:hypothetical protein